MVIRKYNDANAYDAHSGTIRAHEVLDKASGFAHPFDSAWGYLPGPGGALEPHAHDANEIYIVFKGDGTVMVDGETAKVACGDIIEIPGGKLHNIQNDGQGELLWLAFWWPVPLTAPGASPP